jgi:hypothetical protein
MTVPVTTHTWRATLERLVIAKALTTRPTENQLNSRQDPDRRTNRIGDDPLGSELRHRLLA